MTKYTSCLFHRHSKTGGQGIPSLMQTLHVWRGLSLGHGMQSCLFMLFDHLMAISMYMAWSSVVVSSIRIILIWAFTQHTKTQAATCFSKKIRQRFSQKSKLQTKRAICALGQTHFHDAKRQKLHQSGETSFENDEAIE